MIQGLRPDTTGTCQTAYAGGVRIASIIVSKSTATDIPGDVRMKMLVLHAPEKLGLKQEYIQEHQAVGH